MAWRLCDYSLPKKLKCKYLNISDGEQPAGAMVRTDLEIYELENKQIRRYDFARLTRLKRLIIYGESSLEWIDEHSLQEMGK